MKEIPSSVYHLQINETFPLKEAIQLLSYFEALGIEGVYCSPVFEAISQHGYDIVNPNKINPKIGTQEDFDTFCDLAKQKKLKLILDTVPNHMGIKGSKNFWWLDVLENGPDSLYAEFFDIDWTPRKPEIFNKVLLPILGNTYGKTLLNQEIQLLFEHDGFKIQYGDYLLPVAPESYSYILEAMTSPLNASEWEKCLQIALQLKHETDAAHKKALKKELIEHCQKAAQTIEKLCLLFNGNPQNHQSFDLLHELLEMQHYRLAHWLVAAQEINYRRFFNINELIAIHIEKDNVLNAHHRLVFELLNDGKVQGLRIDHPDGLYDPEQYFDKLQAHKPGLVVVEKILDINETLPEKWNVDGTVGYEFLNLLTGVFIDKKEESHFSKIYHEFVGYKIDFDLLLYARKKEFISKHMNGETNTLGHKLSRIAESNRNSRDFSQSDLTLALKEIMACFPVYRTYIRPGTDLDKKDKDYILQAIETARKNRPDIAPPFFNYLHDFFIKSPQDHTPKEIDFILRFQQQTAPMMAKGLEDSCFYIYNRFVALNEVGGNPRFFGTTKDQFHHSNREKLQKWPFGFLPSSTQDTKWSEDARMRLCVLSEIPDKWSGLLALAKEENQKYKIKIHGLWFPDVNTEYYLYQLLLAIWPHEPEEAKLPGFKERLWTGFLKAIREAGLFSDWRNPNDHYETAAQKFLFSIMTESPFLASFLKLQKELNRYGRQNSLSMLILKMGSCGIVDIYQGNEFWNYCMMDPDNRRPIDFDALQQALNQTTPLKMQITAQSLKFRKAHKELLLKGDYIPLETTGVYKDNIVAFLRQNDKECALFAAARFFTQLPSPPIGKNWHKTEIHLPKNFSAVQLTDIFTQTKLKLQKNGHSFTLNASDCFQNHPFTILSGTF